MSQTPSWSEIQGWMFRLLALAVLFLSPATLPARSSTVVGAPPGFMELCFRNASLCQHSQSSAIPRTMLDQINAINLRVNQGIAPRNLKASPYQTIADASDWQTLAPGATGDCKDYALTKLFLLSWNGVPMGAMKLAIVHVPGSPRDQNHAVLVVHVENDFLVLDNLNNQLVSLSHLPYQLLALQDPGSQAWTALD